eukprot:278835_1
MDDLFTKDYGDDIPVVDTIVSSTDRKSMDGSYDPSIQQLFNEINARHEAKHEEIKEQNDEKKDKVESKNNDIDENNKNNQPTVQHNLLIAYESELYPFNISETMTVKRLKTLIEEQYMHPANQQRLRQRERRYNRALNNETCAKTFLHGPTTILELFVYNKTSIQIQVDGQPVVVNPYDKFDSLRNDAFLRVMSSVNRKHLLLKYNDIYLCHCWDYDFTEYCVQDGDKFQFVNGRKWQQNFVKTL